MNVNQTPERPPMGALVRRTVVSLVLPALFVWGEHVPGPGIDVAALKSPEVPFQVVSPFALGVTPLLSAYVFVELCALLRKRWRTLRHDWPRGRAQLERVAWALALVFAAFQVLGVTQLMLAMPSSIAILAPSHAFVFGLSMLAGTAVTMLMARAISQQGLVNGIMLFALIDAGGRLVSAPHADWVIGCAAAALGIATWIILPRASQRNSEQLQLVPRLTSTFHPPVMASSLLALPGALAAVGGSSVAAFTDALSEPAGLLVALSLGTLLVGLALSLLFQLPRQVAALAPPNQASPERATQALNAALPATLLYLACAAFVFTTCEARHFALAPLVAPLIAMTLDFVANCRLAREDLVCIHEERRPSRLEAIRERLCAAHVTHFIVDHNQLVGHRLFAPFIAARVLVRRTDSSTARERLLDASPAQRVEPAASTPSTTTASAAGATSGRVPQLAALGALAAVSLFLALQPVSRVTSNPQSNNAPSGNSPSGLAKFELDFVDDEQTPFDDFTETQLPRGASLMSEAIDAFGPHPRSGHYLRLVPVDHETFAETARRVEPWLRQLRLPVNERVALGPYVDLDPAGKEAQVGLRTYVVRTPAIITATDIEYANASRSKSHQRPVVHLRLRPSIVWRFQQATREAVGKRWAILIDEQVESAPVIRHEIADGTLQIVMGGRGEKDMARARELARKLFP